MLQQREKYVILVTVLMILIVVASLLGVYADYTDGFKEEFTGLYLSAGDTVFYSDGSAVLGDVEFKVHNAWDLNSHYTVKVVPTGEDFFYRVEGENRWYSYLDNVEDLTSVFDIEVKGSKFVIHCKGKIIRAVLEEYYSKKVEIPAVDNDVEHFKIVVTLTTGWVSERSIEVSFCSVPGIGVGGVELDTPLVSF